jgi:putative membrane protein
MQEMNMAERTSDTVKNTVKHLEKSANATERLADQTTTLAADRTVLAGERTYAAWVRTGLASLASGVGARALPGGALPAWLINALGSLLIAFSAFCFVAAVWRGLSNGPMAAVPSVKRMPRAVMLGVSGALLLAALGALVGIWVV